MEKRAIFCPVSREPIQRVAKKRRNRVAAVTRIDFVCPMIFLGVRVQKFRMIR